NPHAWIYIVTNDAKDAGVEWSLECRSVAELSRQGLRSTDLRTGDKLDVEVWPAKDGRTIATVLHGMTANGKSFAFIRGPNGAVTSPNLLSPPSLQSGGDKAPPQ